MTGKRVRAALGALLAASVLPMVLSCTGGTPSGGAGGATFSELLASMASGTYAAGGTSGPGAIFNTTQPAPNPTTQPTPTTSPGGGIDYDTLFQITVDSARRILVPDAICATVDRATLPLLNPTDPIVQRFFEDIYVQTTDGSSFSPYAFTLTPYSTEAIAFTAIDPVLTLSPTRVSTRVLFDNCDPAFALPDNPNLLYWDYIFRAEIRLKANGRLVWSRYVIFRECREQDFTTVSLLPFTPVVRTTN